MVEDVMGMVRKEVQLEEPPCETCWTGLEAAGWGRRSYGSVAGVSSDVDLLWARLQCNTEMWMSGVFFVNMEHEWVILGREPFLLMSELTIPAQVM